MPIFAFSQVPALNDVLAEYVGMYEAEDPSGGVWTATVYVEKNELQFHIKYKESVVSMSLPLEVFGRGNKVKRLPDGSILQMFFNQFGIQLVNDTTKLDDDMRTDVGRRIFMRPGFLQFMSTTQMYRQDRSYKWHSIGPLQHFQPELKKISDTPIKFNELINPKQNSKVIQLSDYKARLCSRLFPQ